MNNKKNQGYSHIGEDVELLTRAEACQFLRVSQSLLDAHLKIPKIRIGRKVLYSKASLIHFLKEAESNE